MSTLVKECALLFVELRAADPEATSALQVARAHLVEGAALVGLRRWRVFELRGELPDPPELEARVHRSTQFYNPAKERGTLLAEGHGGSPAAADEALVLVFDRGGERRPAAERWWRHDGGAKVEVREGTAWALRFEGGPASAAQVEGVAVTKSRASGLLCNPHSQEWRWLPAGERPPLDWISRRKTARAGRGPGGNAP
ncbi:MAG: hypothetical protein HZA61_05545 [Candidatus Eisenbacteria bacterium]|uniref:Uncharacterized protein n=1 Tax=Eiseniibacteriota bacterium TaxID=2212470 RepID=A0A933W2J6_UNCEI|nr:hypothetical protein [Candidatus Eisenbacteria bacterium]